MTPWRLSTASGRLATASLTNWWITSHPPCSIRGLKRGETALVQLGNVAEFYITFFALLRIGVAPVNALFSHQRSELNAYAAQIKPVLLIADREHALFADDSFLHGFIAEHPSLRVALLRNDGGERDPATEISRTADNFVANPTPADEVAFSSSPAAAPGRRSLFREPITITTTVSAAATRSAVLTPTRAISTRCRRRTTMR